MAKTDEAVQGELVPDAKLRSVELTGPNGTHAITGEQAREMTFAQLTELFGATDATAAIGTDQFGPVLEDKSKLVGVPFYLVAWHEYSGDFGGFVSLWVLTADEQRYIVNDGSTGIRDQLRALTAKTGQNAGVMCKHGLRVSEYEYQDERTGDMRPAKTYYIDTKL